MLSFVAAVAAVLLRKKHLTFKKKVTEKKESRRTRKKRQTGTTEGQDKDGKRPKQTGNSNSNSKTLILKDSSIMSIWTCLTASPCYTTNTNKHGYTTNRYYKHE